MSLMPPVTTTIMRWPGVDEDLNAESREQHLDDFNYEFQKLAREFADADPPVRNEFRPTRTADFLPFSACGRINTRTTGVQHCGSSVNSILCLRNSPVFSGLYL